MVPIEGATAVATLLPSTSFCVVRTRRPPTNELTKPLLPFWKSPSTTCSTRFAGSLRFADERGRQFFCALACTAGLSAHDSSSRFLQAHTWQHLVGRSGGSCRSVGTRVRSRLSSQAGSPHRHRPLRLHSKSALSRKRHPGSRSRNCHALVDLSLHPYFLLRDFLFHRDAEGND